MRKLDGVISDRLRALFSPNDPGWTYKRPPEPSPTAKPTKLPKGVQGARLSRRRKRK